MSTRTIRVILDVTIDEVDSEVTDGLCDSIQDVFATPTEGSARNAICDEIADLVFDMGLDFAGLDVVSVDLKEQQ